MFCENPKGPSTVTYVHLRDNMGFISCGLCKEIMKEAVQIWMEKVAYGRVRYLKDSIIKIKRSSGAIDDGWNIDSPYITLERQTQKELVYCVNNVQNLQKWCSVDEIIELNPSAGAPEQRMEVLDTYDVETMPSIIINKYNTSTAMPANLCTICGINMGDDNPRQLCGKTHCENEWLLDDEIKNNYSEVIHDFTDETNFKIYKY